MTGLIDDPPNPVPAEVALVIRGEFRDDVTAYREVARIQATILSVLEEQWPNCRIELAQSLVGDPGGESDDSGRQR